MNIDDELEDMDTTMSHPFYYAKTSVNARYACSVAEIGMMYIRLVASLREAEQQRNVDKKVIFMDGIEMAQNDAKEIEKWLLSQPKTFADDIIDSVCQDLTEKVTKKMEELDVERVKSMELVKNLSQKCDKQAHALMESQDRLNAAQQIASVTRNQLHELTKRNAFNQEVRDKVWSMTDGRCYYCDVELVRCAVELQPNDLRRVYHVDHLVPRSVGGPDHVCNYVPACGPCNISKGDKSYIEFVRDRHPRLKLVVSQ